MIFAKKIEPNVSLSSERADTLKKLKDEGIPTVVWFSPVLPFINDTEENVRKVVELCESVGVYGIICFGMGLTLRDGNREYFYNKLDSLFPKLKEKYIQTYGNSYIVNSPDNDRLMSLFHKLCEEKGIIHDNNSIFKYLSSFEEKNIQLSLFD